MKIKRKNKKVVMAMSGGIDSSVGAALLKKEGFDVRGIFMELWQDPSKFSKKRAEKAAKLLEIPFQVLDLKKEFKRKVIGYFLKEYKSGRTPNPCVVCNKEIKFSFLLKKARELGADFIATGHYAVKQEKKRNKKEKTEYKLLKGRDKEKDQSYFLWQLNQKTLKKVLFPLGTLKKKKVKNLAKKFGLPVKNIGESQEICFVKTSINDFLKQYIGARPGNIVDEKGNLIGKHRGLHFYTIGQRKGLGISGGPWYVLSKDLKKNILIVTKNEENLKKKKLIVENVNWISGRAPKLPLKIKTKIRYKSPLREAEMKKKKGEKFFKVVFSKKQKSITPGQSIVFYKDEEVLGGGIIRKTED